SYFHASYSTTLYRHRDIHPRASTWVPALRVGLEKNLLLLYTGESRRANTILAEQSANMRREDKFQSLQKMRDLAGDTRNCFTSGLEPRELGRLLHEGWLLKKELAGGITTSAIDAYYEKALAAGAYGGKVSGAGGGGFLLLVVPPEKRQAVRQSLSELQEMDFAFEAEGSKIIYVI
ncbi:MAG: GHMP kinase, partial [Dehalococcoidia bacterium]